MMVIFAAGTKEKAERLSETYYDYPTPGHILVRLMSPENYHTYEGARPADIVVDREIPLPDAMERMIEDLGFWLEYRKSCSDQ